MRNKTARQKKYFTANGPLTEQATKHTPTALHQYRTPLHERYRYSVCMPQLKNVTRNLHPVSQRSCKYNRICTTEYANMVDGRWVGLAHHVSTDSCHHERGHPIRVRFHPQSSFRISCLGLDKVGLVRFGRLDLWKAPGVRDKVLSM